MQTIVIYGNCQAAAVAKALKSLPHVSSRFEVHHHFVSNKEPSQGVWEDHIRRSHAIVVQNVADWDGYPFKDCLPAETIRVDVPFIYLASLWPFDCMQNPADEVANMLRPQNQDWDFAYQDSILARLRNEIARPEERYRAYVEMSYPGAISLKRYHDIEACRLLNSDKKLGLNVGSFVINNFQTQRLFHTITHPAPALMEVLVGEILQKLMIPFNPSALSMNDDFAYYQVPVHPKVISDLNIEWANETSKYQFYDRRLTFGEYFKKYIEVYG